jgi:hypothetical protein
VSTPTLAEFLAARLDEDEGAARSAGAGTWSAAGGDLYDGTDPHTRNAIGETWEWERDYGEGLAAVAHIARHDPSRVLREIEAKRAILNGRWGGPDHEDMWEHHVRLLATIWSDHPEYRAEWKP